MPGTNVDTACKREVSHYRWNTSIIILVISLGAAATFLYVDRFNHISDFIDSFGMSGIAGAVLIMALICMTPVPSEGLLILYFKIYGVFWGTTFAWCGYLLGSVVVFGLARYIGLKIVHRWISLEHFDAIDDWISRKGTLGLLIVRLLPIPALIVNIITGVLPSVSLWRYTWTGAIAIIPYYIGVSLLFLGAMRQEVFAFLIGIPVLAAIWILGYWGRCKGRC